MITAIGAKRLLSDIKSVTEELPEMFFETPSVPAELLKTYPPLDISCTKLDKIKLTLWINSQQYYNQTS